MRDGLSRRDFLGLVAAGGLVAACRPGRARAPETQPRAQFGLRALSVAHLPGLQAHIDRLRSEGELADNPVYRSYIDNKALRVPESFPDARFVVITAWPTPHLVATFIHEGRRREVTIPSGYWSDGSTPDQHRALVTTAVGPGARVEPAKGLFLKTLAVASGLARYGRNNISYVPGMGTCHALAAYWTDHPCEDSFGELAFLDRCADCGVCRGRCPTGAIRADHVVIDAGRCVTLYNEVEGAFPDWIPPGAHNALVGCLRCQEACPQNLAEAPPPVRADDVTEDETRMLLSGTPEPALLASVKTKLHDAVDADSYATISRNLRALWQI
jgi:epoxyqueuosine reductase